MTVSRTGDMRVSRAGDVTVSRAGDVTVRKLNIPPAPFKGGDGMVSRTGRCEGQQDGET